MTLTPAYGRDYTSKAKVKADFDADKDFIVADIGSQYNGSYINKSQLKGEGITSVMIRYKKLTQVQPFKVK